jgi:hypothetical protein
MAEPKQVHEYTLKCKLGHMAMLSPGVLDEDMPKIPQIANLINRDRMRIYTQESDPERASQILSSTNTPTKKTVTELDLSEFLLGGSGHITTHWADIDEDNDEGAVEMGCQIDGIVRGETVMQTSGKRAVRDQYVFDRVRAYMYPRASCFVPKLGICTHILYMWMEQHSLGVFYEKMSKQIGPNLAIKKHKRSHVARKNGLTEQKKYSSFSLITGCESEMKRVIDEHGYMYGVVYSKLDKKKELATHYAFCWLLERVHYRRRLINEIHIPHMLEYGTLPDEEDVLYDIFFQLRSRWSIDTSSNFTKKWEFYARDLIGYDQIPTGNGEYKYRLCDSIQLKQMNNGEWDICFTSSQLLRDLPSDVAKRYIQNAIYNNKYDYVIEHLRPNNKPSP